MKYFEKNLTTTENTTYYYLGDKRVAMKKVDTLSYIHQDHLTGTSVVTSDNGSLIGSIKYYPYGECLKSQGTLGTDRLFTGQLLDTTGLYYYGARYYDPTIGRFISPDTIVPNYTNPQSLNRYSYCINNPLKYKDDSGHFWGVVIGAAVGAAAGAVTYWATTSTSERTAAGWTSAAIGGALMGLTLGMASMAVAEAANYGMSTVASLATGGLVALMLTPPAGALGMATKTVIGGLAGEPRPSKVESIAWMSQYVLGPGGLLFSYINPFLGFVVQTGIQTFLDVKAGNADKEDGSVSDIDGSSGSNEGSVSQSDVGYTDDYYDTSYFAADVASGY